MHPDLIFAVLTGIVAAEVAVWAVATKAAWRAIRKTILLVGFGVGATLAFLFVAEWVDDTRVLIGLFVALCILGLWIAEGVRR